MQVDVGDPGTAAYATRERYMRRAIDVRATLSDAQGKYESRRSSFATIEADDRSPAGVSTGISNQLERGQNPAESARDMGSRRYELELQERADAQARDESAQLHALLRDPTEGRTMWTLSATELGKLPSSARIAKQIAADKATQPLERISSPATSKRTRPDAASRASSTRKGAEHPLRQSGLTESTKRALLLKVCIIYGRKIKKTTRCKTGTMHLY